MSYTIKALYDDLIRRAPTDSLEVRLYLTPKPDRLPEDEAKYKADDEPRPQTWRDRPPLL